jgi:hypothetical protein
VELHEHEHPLDMLAIDKAKEPEVETDSIADDIEQGAETAGSRK